MTMADVSRRRFVVGAAAVVVVRGLGVWAQAVSAPGVVFDGTSKVEQRPQAAELKLWAGVL